MASCFETGDTHGMNNRTLASAGSQRGAASILALGFAFCGLASLCAVFGSRARAALHFDSAVNIQQDGQDEKGQDGEQGDENPTLGRHMKAIGRLQKGLSKGLGELGADSDAAAFDELIGMAREGQMHVLSAKNHDPKKMSTLDEDKRAKFAVDYRRAMKDFLNGWLDLELALLERNVEAAQKAMKAVGGQKKGGHDAFKGKEGRRR